MQPNPRNYPLTFIKDNSTVIVGTMLVYLRGMILMPIIIKTAGVAVYGGFVLLMSILGIIFGVSSFGVGFKAKRLLPSAALMAGRGELFYRQFLFQLFSILFLSFAFMLLNRQIGVSIFKNEVNYSAGIIPLYLFCYLLYSQASDYFRYTSRINAMTIATVIFPYLNIGIVLLFLFFYKSLNINFLILSETFSALLVAMPCFWTIFSEIGVRALPYPVKDIVDDIRLGFPLVLGFIVDFVLAGSDRYFIAFYLSVAAVGYYNPAYAIGSLIIFVPKAMGTVLPQLMSKASDQKSEYEAQRMMDYAIKIFLLLAIPFIFASMVTAKAVLTFLANADVAQRSFLVVPIVALGTLFYGLNLILSNALFVHMKTKEMFKMNLLASGFNMLANLILLYFIRDILVAAITTFLSYLIAFIYINRTVGKIWVVDYQIEVVAKSVLASLLMTAVLCLISAQSGQADTIITLIGQLVLGTFVYLAGIFGLRVFSIKELEFVKRFLVR